MTAEEQLLAPLRRRMTAEVVAWLAAVDAEAARPGPVGPDASAWRRVDASTRETVRQALADLQAEEAAGALGDKLQFAAALRDAEQPHVLLQTDPETGARQVFGPYATQHAALQAIAALTARDRAELEPPLPTYEPMLYFTPPAGTGGPE